MLLVLAVSFAAFMLLTLSPVDPVQQYLLHAGTAVSQAQRAEIEARWGVHEPPLARYCGWLAGVLRGDLGESALYQRPAAAVISERVGNSLLLMAAAWLASGCIGFALGCVMSVYENRLPDRVLKKLCCVLSSVPSFWLGLLLLLVFSVQLGWFPIGFSGPIGVPEEEITFGQRLHHVFLPAAAVSLVSFAHIALHTRQKFTGVFASDYVLFAKARGETRWTILARHGVRNILFPAVTLQFSSFAELFGGSVLAETVFSYPGLGSAAAAAGLNGDMPLLLGITVCSALFVRAGNLIADTLYGVIDPRVRESQI